MVYYKFLTLILKVKFRRDCAVFLLFRLLSEFSGLKAILSELFKVNRIDFRKAEKKLPKELSKDVISKFLVIYLENEIPGENAPFWCFWGFFGHFQRF